MLSPERLAAVIAATERAGMAFLSDEIYHGLSYGTAAAATALSFSDRAIVINSFSKYFSMTGWRVGWLVLPDELVRPVERLMQNLFISAPAISQVAALAAFDATEELEAIKAGYARNRALLLRELPGVGFGKLLPADGAFYLYADVGDRTADSLGVLQADAGRDRRRDHARDRLRPDARTAVRAVFVCRDALREMERGDGAVGKVAGLVGWVERSEAHLANSLAKGGLRAKVRSTHPTIAGVATTPGIDFDPMRGRQFVRFSYAGSLGEMEEAMERLGKWQAS